MISYKPLQHTLIEKGVKKMELVKMVPFFPPVSKEALPSVIFYFT